MTTPNPIRSRADDEAHWKKVDQCLTPSINVRTEGKKGVAYFKQVVTNIRDIVKSKAFQIYYKIFSQEHIWYGNDYAIKALEKCVRGIKERPSNIPQSWAPTQVMFAVKTVSHLKDLAIDQPKTDAIFKDLDAINKDDPQVVSSFKGVLDADRFEDLDKIDQKRFNEYLSMANYKNPDPRDLFIVGYCYENGIGVDKNTREAEKFYKKADEMGTFLAMTSLGYRSLSWFHRQAPDAMHPPMPGTPSRNPIFREMIHAHLRWNELAAKKGSTVAMRTLANYYHKMGHRHVQAMGWYQKLVALGQVDVLPALEECYKRDFEYYKMEAERGDWQTHWQVMLKLAELYRKGIGTPVNPQLADEWELKAKPWMAGVRNKPAS